jgi:exo-1,4-beta-D-glucosaminidase
MSDQGGDKEITVTLRNPGKQIAFFIELSVRGDKSGRTIVPVFWDDNYVSLLPGASKTIRATFAAADLGDEKPVFSFKGWNVKGE